jgi:hypothetical protein
MSLPSKTADFCLRPCFYEKPQTLFNHSALGAYPAAPQSFAHQRVVNFDVCPHSGLFSPMCRIPSFLCIRQEDLPQVTLCISKNDCLSEPRLAGQRRRNCKNARRPGKVARKKCRRSFRWRQVAWFAQLLRLDVANPTKPPKPAR